MIDLSELYKGMAGSPITYLASDISAGQTTISVADDTALPDAPNICTIGYGEEIETIKYGTKSNGVLQNVTRGIEGAPRTWQAGTEVARFFTAYDHDAIAEVLGKNPIWFSEFEEALINSVSTKIFKNLFGNGSKIHASEIITGTQDNYNTVEDHITDYEALIGEIKMYAGSTAPNKHLLCNGTAVSRTTYAKLFAVIGTTYGSGNGSTTFNLPNFKGRIPVGYDNGQSEFNTLGKTGGSKTHTLVENEMPKHDHGVSSSGTAGGALNHAGAYIASCEGTSVGWSRRTTTAGNNSAHNNLQPYISVNYIIRVQ